MKQAERRVLPDLSFWKKIFTLIVRIFLSVFKKHYAGSRLGYPTQNFSHIYRRSAPRDEYRLGYLTSALDIFGFINAGVRYIQMLICNIHQCRVKRFFVLINKITSYYSKVVPVLN
jgi:hypothetical protein